MQLFFIFYNNAYLENLINIELLKIYELIIYTISTAHQLSTMYTIQVSYGLSAISLCNAYIDHT